MVIFLCNRISFNDAFAPTLTPSPTASSASSFALGLPSMTADLGCSQFEAYLALGMFPLGFGVVPFFASPLSESWGRRPVFLLSGLLLVLTHIMAGLARNTATVVVARFLQGSSAILVNVVGGAIADMWLPIDRGLPMAVFSATAMGANGVGPIFSGWIEQSPLLGWRWIQWVHLMEPVVTSFSIWISFVWGVYYGILASLPAILRTVHGFSASSVGLAYIAIILGAALGFCTNLCLERYQSTRSIDPTPESRLAYACVSAVVFPLAMVFFAVCSIPSVHWAALEVALVLCVWSIFGVYGAVFAYLTDCYGPYASSALATQSLLRNIAGAGFPLFINKMFQAWSFRSCNLFFAGMAVLLIPIPFILVRFGPNLRAKSPFSDEIMNPRMER
ncbi:unnamed protein product [Mycena citricolor]|uniref:Major facilitator superfamily (MFS) profile domain-containing protein n=1 Tax=Mycena citricolor TaxID=2018698 RepID=A0AAD2HGA5_9AGAR|nr:unnamed protein product [Mycena citricolor]